MRCRRRDCTGTLRWRPPSSRHVLGDHSLSDINAELEQLPWTPRRTPEWVCDAHLADEAANFCEYTRPSAARTRFPTPVGSKPRAVPTQQRLQSDNLQSVQRQAIETHKQQPIDAAECRFGHLRCMMLSRCRSIRISASNAARDRNSPIKAHQLLASGAGDRASAADHCAAPG
jgi:hypothetical protein